MQYHQRLKDLREDFDKSQEEIAEIIGTSQSYYAQYENEKRSLPFERAIILAKYYNVSLDYIAGLINSPQGIGGTPYKISKNITINNQGGNNKINIKN